MVGEREICSTDSEPQWHFLAVSSPRIRRKVKYADNSLKGSEIEKFDVVKSQNVISNQRDPVYKKARVKRKRKLLVSDKEHKISVWGSGFPRVPQVNMVEPEQQNTSLGKWKNSQSSSLELEIKELCDALNLPENVKSTSVTILEYIMDDFVVSWETTHTSQAFQISLCWIAAALMEYKIDHRESLVLAKQHLKFDCEEDEVDYIYSKLHKLNKEFRDHIEDMQIDKEPNHAKTSKSTPSDQGDLEGEELIIPLQSQSLPAPPVNLEEGEIPVGENLANLSKSARLDQQDLEEGEIEGESHRLNVLDNLVDLEEGEIPVCSNHTNDFNSTTFDQQYLEEGEILVIPHNHKHWDQPVPKTVEDKSASERLDDSLEGKRDNSNGQMEMLQKILEPTSGVVDVQLKADDQIVHLEKAMKKPVPSQGSTGLSDSESKIDKNQSTNTSSTSIGSQSGVDEAKSSLPNHCETPLVVPPQASDSSLNEKELRSSQVGAVPTIKECDAESAEVEEIIVKSGTSTCVHNEMGTNGLKDGGPGLTYVERHSPDDNVHIIDTAVRSSNDSQKPLNEAVTVGEPMHCSTQAMHLQNQSVGVERINVSEVGQEISSVVSVCTESPVECAAARPSVVRPDISADRRNSISFHQPSIPTVSLHASAQEVQFSRQPTSEDHMESANPYLEYLPLPSSRRTQMGGSHAYARTNVQDFRSTASILESIHPPLPANHVMPESSQLAWYDPLRLEMERLKKKDEQDFKMYEQTILHIKSQRDKEIDEVLKKYDMLLQDAEKELLQKRMDHRTIFQKVYLNKLLAEALMLKQNEYSGALRPDTRTAPVLNITNQLSNPTQMSAMGLEQNPPSLLSASSVEVINHTSLVHSNGCLSPTSGIMEESQHRHALRGPAPHLHSSIQQSLMSTLRLPALSYAAQNQHFPSSRMTPPNI